MKKKQLLPLLLSFAFLLGIRDGRIALWRSGETEPVRIFPYRAEMLPPEDQKALEKGIVISDENALSRILEDYLS